MNLDDLINLLNNNFLHLLLALVWYNVKTIQPDPVSKQKVSLGRE